MLCCGLKAICQTETSLLHMMEFVLHLKRSMWSTTGLNTGSSVGFFLFILMICVMFVAIVCPFYLLMTQIFLQLVKNWMILRNWLTRNLLTFLCGWMQIDFPGILRKPNTWFSQGKREQIKKLISETKSSKFLGVYIDNCLNWKKHLSNTAS